MPFTPEEVTELGYSSLNYFLANNPIDQIAQQRPLLRKLMAGKRTFPGGNDSIVEQLRKSYDNNMKWFQGSAQVDYNKRNTLTQAKFPWKGCHDGFEMSEDYLLSNGITITDSATPATNSRGERLRLTNLFKGAMEVLRLGFEEQLDYDLHLATPAAEQIDGLDSLVSLTPALGTVGGIDRATDTWWRNQTAIGLPIPVDAATGSQFINGLETMWRAQLINGGTPDCIIAGARFVDQFRAAAKGEISRYMVQNTTFTSAAEFDPSTKQGADGTFTGLHFQGVPIVYDPTFEVIDAAAAPTTLWTNRAYFLNMKHLKLRPAEGHDMVARKPPRAYDYYVHRWGLTWKGALSMNRSNCHGVATVAV